MMRHFTALITIAAVIIPTFLFGETFVNGNVSGVWDRDGSPLGTQCIR